MKHIGEILQKTTLDWQASLPGFGVASSASQVGATVDAGQGAGEVGARSRADASPALSPSVTRGQQSVGGAQ